MTAITYTYGRGWHPVRDTSNPSRDPLSFGRSSFGALNWLRHHALRGRPLAKLAAAERRIAARAVPVEPETYLARLSRHDPMAAEILAPVIEGMFAMARVSAMPATLSREGR